MVNLNQNDNNNFNENFIPFTANFNHNQKICYKNSARNNNLRFIDSDNNHVLRIYHQNICGLGSKMNDLHVSLYPSLSHIVCLTFSRLMTYIYVVLSKTKTYLIPSIPLCYDDYFVNMTV